MAVIETFPSSSSDRMYTVQTDSQGQIWCTCPAWRFQKKSTLERQCKHMKQLGLRGDSYLFGDVTPATPRRPVTAGGRGKGKGKGWHEDHARHVAAAKRGKTGKRDMMGGKQASYPRGSFKHGLDQVAVPMGRTKKGEPTFKLVPYVSGTPFRR